MLKFALRRVAASLLILLGTTVFIYALLLAAPGGPEQKYANNPRFTKAQQQAYVKALGLDQPVPVQYCRWLGACRRDADGLEALIGPTGLPSILPAFLSGVNTGIVHGDFGYSYENGNAVSDRIGGALLPTLILAGLSAALWLSIAVVLGVVTALRNGGLFDNAFSVFTYVTAAFPTFILGFALISIFSVGLGLTPVSGMTDGRLSPAFGSDGYWVYFSANPGTAIADLASHLILPVVTLVTISVAGDARYVRQSVIESRSVTMSNSPARNFAIQVSGSPQTTYLMPSSFVPSPLYGFFHLSFRTIAVSTSGVRLAYLNGPETGTFGRSSSRKPAPSTMSVAGLPELMSYFSK